MKFYLITILLFSGSILHAQNKGTIAGTVVDMEQKALEKATVSVLNHKDSTVISYTLADDKGKFKLYKLPLNQSITLIISHVGTSPYSKELELTSEEEYDLGTLSLEANVLNEVVISAQPPVRMNNDSLEYNATYFKTRPNASVEELLKKLPGLQVNFDGSIYFQGKEVSKVLVNDKEFFAQDLRIATRNLDAEMVDVVQVYRDKGDSKKEVEDESTLPITINLKFKKQLAHADFGKFYGSGGTNDRYESGLLLNTFRDTLQISFIGFGNNINRQSFDYGELSQHAGLGRAENYGFQDFGGRNYQGIQNDISGGVNINYDWGNTTKLNIMYQYAYGNELNENNVESETFYDVGTQNSQYKSDYNSKNYKNTLSGRFNHKFDTTAFLRYTPSLAFNKSKSENNQISATNSLDEAINKINSASNDNAQSINYRHDIYIEKALNQKVIVSLNNSLYYNGNDNKNLNNQLNTIYAESSNAKRRLVQTDNETSDINNKVNGNLQLKLHKKLSADLFLDFNYLHFKREEELALGIDDQELRERNDSENDLNFTTKDYAVGTKWSWTILKDLNLQAGVKLNYKQNTFDYFDVLKTRRDKNKYWLPSVNMRYKTLSINYAKNVTHPQVYSIRTVDNTLNEMGITRAFPYAENKISDVISLNMYQYFNNYKNQLSFYGNYTKDSYFFGYKTTQDLTTGRYESETYLAPGSFRLSAGLNFSQQIKLSEEWNLRVNENLNSYTNDSYRITNDVENKNISWGGNTSHELTFSWKDIIAISPKYSLDFNKNFVSADNPNFKNSSSLSHSFTTGVNVTNVKNFSLETSYRLTSLNGGFKKNPTMNIVNLSLYYDMLTKGQIKLSVFDLLNQNISFHNASFANTNYYNESITLKQYFLLGYIYKFNKAKMK